MSIELSEEDVTRLVSALEHYEAYLSSQKREDCVYYRDLAERLQRIKKPPASVTKTGRKGQKPVAAFPLSLLKTPSGLKIWMLGYS